MVVSGRHGEAAYVNGQAKKEEGDALIEQCLDLMKAKIDVPSDTIKAYAQSLKQVVAELQKLAKKPRR